MQLKYYVHIPSWHCQKCLAPGFCSPFTVSAHLSDKGHGWHLPILLGLELPSPNLENNSHAERIDARGHRRADRAEQEHVAPRKLPAAPQETVAVLRARGAWVNQR